jgi:D-alanyl-D-alanine carboxypeptidase
VVRYTASDEEDLINAATLALPSSVAKNMTATTYVVKDLSTGSTVLTSNADQLVPIASLTKLVTAVLVRRLIPDATRITITKSVMATYGNTAGFSAGETFTADDLLYPLLMVSSNDAAEAYAQYYGRAKFIQAMNDFTQSIGAYRTSFADPAGLDPKSVSTANDMALTLDWIRKNDPAILAVTELKAKTIRSHTWINPTHFLSWSYYQGGKNGYLPESDRTTASLFTLGTNKDIYAVVVLGSSDRDSDVIKLLKKAGE